MTIKRTEEEERAEWQRRRRLSGSTLVESEENVDPDGGDSPFSSSSSSNNSSETKLSHIYDVYAGDLDDGAKEQLLSRRVLSEVLPYDKNLSGSTLVSEKSPSRPMSPASTLDAKKKDYRHAITSQGGMDRRRRRRAKRKPQWLETSLAPCHVCRRAVCRTKKVR